MQIRKAIKVRCSTFNELPVRAIFAHKVIKNASVAVNQNFYLQQRRGPINFSSAGSLCTKLMPGFSMKMRHAGVWGLVGRGGSAP